MSMMDQVLDRAELGMRARGYHAVSFRDLATELGIKSASIHYYFRQKEDLGVALVERYTERFFAALDAQAVDAASVKDRLAIFGAAYRRALVDDERICLCGMLAAENKGLPEALATAVASFMRLNMNWIETALGTLEAPQRRRQAAQIVSTLQGALILSDSLKDPRIFDEALAGLLAGFND